MNSKYYLVASIVIFIAAQAIAGAFRGSVLYPTSAPSDFGQVFPANKPEASAGGETGGASQTHAVYWTSAGTAVDLNPTNLSGLTTTWVNGTDGSQQVGFGYGSNINQGQALLWSGSPESAVNLNPVGFLGATAYATYGGEQVGSGSGNGVTVPVGTQALLWKGSAASAINLNPTNLPEINTSVAYGLSSTEQVGEGQLGPENPHALLWTGSAASAVDLNVSGALDKGVLINFVLSEAYGTAGDEQVGYETQYYTASKNAFLWTGTAASAVDLDPSDLSGFTNSVANGTNGAQQVGYGFGPGTSNNDHALLWSGTANSAVDLQSMLPSSGVWSTSIADTIDSSGNIYGLATGVYDGVNGIYAVEWSPLPEPSSGLLAGLLSGVGLLLRRRRNSNPNSL